MSIKYEILAPAGSFETFIAVLNAGADAVYLGGLMFGARAYAGNLSEEEILAAIDYAHIHDKRVYLTVNTLLKNNELFGDLYKYIRPYYEAGLDGVIVQDYGVMKFIHDNFPGMEIHASTQMTITDSGYTDFLKEYNVTRIVPAREMSLEDIRLLRAGTDMEIECFVHGALCYSYSGMCFMSSFIGGRSGNRGRCAQPCRLNYCNKNILSLKDLCTLDILPDILEAGVFSLKIEGRMKSPEYAAGVTSIYRKYVDLYIEKGRNGYKVDEEDRKKLLMLFDRGGMTKGYYVMHNGPKMIANEQKSDKSLTQKESFEKCIAEQFLNKQLKEPISMEIKLVVGQNAVMRVCDVMGNSVTTFGAMVERAKSAGMSKDDIRKQITKLGATYFEATEVNVEASEEVFIPNKALNELRRDAIDKLSETRLSGYRRISNKVEYNLSHKKGRLNKLVSRVYTMEQAKAAVNAGTDRLCVECELFSGNDFDDITKLCNNNGVECFLGMPRVFKNGFKSYFEDVEFIKSKNFDGFYIRNIAELEFIKKSEIKGVCVADYTVYGFNDLSVQLLYSHGFDEVTYPVELNEKELIHLKNSNGELVVYGRLPLMVSANCIDKTMGRCHTSRGSFGKITDRKNATLPYVAGCEFCYNVIFNSVPVFLMDKSDKIHDISPSNLALCFTDEDGEEVSRIVHMTKNVLNGKNDNVILPKDFTRGHFTRGVE